MTELKDLLQDMAGRARTYDVTERAITRGASAAPAGKGCRTGFSGHCHGRDRVACQHTAQGATAGTV